MRGAWGSRALFVRSAARLAGCAATADPTLQGASGTADTGCRATHVADGDTIDLACPGMGEVMARLPGFDTPEAYSPGCQEEVAAGREAAAVPRNVLRSGPITGARCEGHDRYGRELLRLEVGGRDVARQMIASGHAVPYSGGRHPNWCGML